MSSYGAVVNEDDDDKNDGERGAFVKKKKCNDVLFAIAYLAHLVVVITVLIRYQPDDTDTDWTSAGVYKFVGVIAGIALVLSTLALSFMSAFTEILIEIALVSSLLATGGVAGYGLYIGKLWMAIVGGIFFLAGCIFTYCVWKKVPFAASNLRTALTAIRTNLGLVILAYFWEAVAFAWTVLWINSAGAAMNDTSWGIIFLYLLSFFWTQQVINNLQHTIASSMIGTWWYNPTDANSFCDDGLNAALCQSLTYSFGSICMGSLLASFIQALKWLHRMSKSNDKCSFLTCIIDCCLQCIQDIVEYFNRWAFTFVGIHGDSFVEAGRHVMSLFKQRGWNAIITDHVAGTVMWTMTLSISLLCGLAGWWLVTFDDDIFVGIGISADKDDAVGFVAGFLIGYLLASIMMELVSSAICAVIVCFAEAPATFQRNYPQLCSDMLQAWKDAYPDECADDFDSVKT